MGSSFFVQKKPEGFAELTCRKFILTSSYTFVNLKLANIKWT